MSGPITRSSPHKAMQPEAEEDSATQSGKRTREQLIAEALAIQQLIDNESDED